MSEAKIRPAQSPENQPTPQTNSTALSLKAITSIERTFAIPELLEWILLYVSTHHTNTNCACDDFKRLFPLQRVSRTFQQTIQCSRSLLHLMVLKPINLPNEILVKTTLGRLQWFYNEFLSTCVDIKESAGGRRDHHSIRLHKISIYGNDNEEAHPTLYLLRTKQDTHASWRDIQVALGNTDRAIRVRLRIALLTKTQPYDEYDSLHAVKLRYTVYWWIAKKDTLGVLFDRYLDVLNRSMEEHNAASETYKLRREWHRYQKRVDAEKAA